MHVEWQLPLSFKTLLLWGDLGISLNLYTLSQELLQSVGSANLLEGSLSFIYQTRTESAKTDLYESPIIQYLSADISTVNVLLEMRHEKHVTSLIELVVESMMVNLT